MAIGEAIGRFASGSYPFSPLRVQFPTMGARLTTNKGKKMTMKVIVKNVSTKTTLMRFWNVSAQALANINHPLEDEELNKFLREIRRIVLAEGYVVHKEIK